MWTGGEKRGVEVRLGDFGDTDGFPYEILL